MKNKNADDVAYKVQRLIADYESNLNCGYDKEYVKGKIDALNMVLVLMSVSFGENYVLSKFN